MLWVNSRKRVPCIAVHRWECNLLLYAVTPCLFDAVSSVPSIRSLNKFFIDIFFVYVIWDVISLQQPIYTITEIVERSDVLGNRRQFIWFLYIPLSSLGFYSQWTFIHKYITKQTLCYIHTHTLPLFFLSLCARVYLYALLFIHTRPFTRARAHAHMFIVICVLHSHSISWLTIGIIAYAVIPSCFINENILYIYTFLTITFE